jgi:uncharacterized membrane protein
MIRAFSYIVGLLFLNCGINSAAVAEIVPSSRSAGGLIYSFNNVTGNIYLCQSILNGTINCQKIGVFPNPSSLVKIIPDESGTTVYLVNSVTGYSLFCQSQLIIGNPSKYAASCRVSSTSLP